jgi:hypothetical protein
MNHGLFHLKGLVSVICIFMVCTAAVAQKTTIDGKEFQSYNASHFKPHRGIFYQFYVSPVITVDPLGLGGLSTYGVSLGSRINLWESKTPDKKLSGLKMKGFYLAGGYEYYPQQYDKIYGSLWLRIKTFMPIAAKLDMIYATGNGLQGLSTRFCFGFEVKKISIFLCGETYKAYYPGLGYHPNSETPYANAGSILAIVPIFTRKEK